MWLNSHNYPLIFLEIREQLQAMHNEEKTLLQQRILLTDGLFRQIVIVVGLAYAFALSLLLLIAVYLLLQKQIRLNKA